MLVAFAGTLVNIILIALAMGIVFFKHPPLARRTTSCYCSFPLFPASTPDRLSGVRLCFGLSGDWSQMYGGGVPWLTAVIVAIQATVIAIGVWISETPKCGQH